MTPSDQPDGLPAWLSRAPDGAWLVRVKAVPGASRDGVAGILGDRLKIRIAAPPEGGKANKAIGKLLAVRLGLKGADIELTAGVTSPEKTLRLPPHVDLKTILRLV